MELDKLLKIDHIRNKLIEPEIDFLIELKNYVRLPIYIYGSVIRKDYFPNKSDIDVSIFTNNPEATINQLLNFLGVGRSKIKIFKLKSVNQKTHKTRVIWGFKTNYMLDVSEYSKLHDKWYDFFYKPKQYKRFEIMIVNKKYKNSLNAINRGHFKIPLIYAMCIYILKLLYYHFYFNETYYRTIKRNIFNYGKLEVQEIEKVGNL
jgi:predicted nucleotidyltransferase